MVHRMAEKTDLTHIKAQEIVEAILQKIKNALRHGDSVILRGFRSFKYTIKGPASSATPKQNHEADIPSRLVVLFRSGKPFRDAVNRSTSPRVSPRIHNLNLLGLFLGRQLGLWATPSKQYRAPHESDAAPSHQEPYPRSLVCCDCQ